MTSDELTKRREAESSARKWGKDAERSRRADQFKKERETRAAHIKKTLELLEVPRSDRARKQVERAMVEVDRRREARTSGLYGTLAKEQKEAAAQFAAALKRLEIKLNSSHLADDVRLGFPLDQIDFVRWIARAEAVASKKLNDRKRPDQAKLYAAKESLRLLKAHGLDARLTRDGTFCKLSALLYGEPDEDFLYHCSKAKKDAASRSRTSKGGPI